MDIETMRAISFIVGCTHNKKNYNSIYDYTTGKFYFLSYSESSVFDYSTSCFLSITKSGNKMYSIFDYRTNKFINLEIGQNDFKGFDYNSSSYYNGTIQGEIVTFYSFQKGKFYQFSLS